jgi:hypothetical protein
MSSAERQRRFLDKIRGTGTAASSSPLEAKCAKLKAECARLKSENATLKRGLDGQRSGSQGQLKVRPGQEFGEFGDVSEMGRLRAEIKGLKSDNYKLKAMLQEEPDALRLRKKLVELEADMATMRRAMKKIARERDVNQDRVKPEYREARQLLTAPNYRVLIKALHSDRSQHVSSAELAEAERLAVLLRPLFIEKD